MAKVDHVLSGWTNPPFQYRRNRPAHQSGEEDDYDGCVEALIEIMRLLDWVGTTREPTNRERTAYMIACEALGEDPFEMRG